MIFLLVVLVVLVVVGAPLAVLRFGADSRDGRDWKPLCGFDSDYTGAVQHGATNQDSVLVHSGGRVSQG